MELRLHAVTLKRLIVVPIMKQINKIVICRNKINIIRGVKVIIDYLYST